MSKRCVFVAMSSQKGGVGKSTMTVLLAGYFHYVMGYNVAVVDVTIPSSVSRRCAVGIPKMWKRT